MRHDWTDLRNAAGFAAECARLALPFYCGDYSSDLIAAIEFVERYADGGEIDSDGFQFARAARYAAAAAADAAAYDAAYAATSAAAAAAAAAAHTSADSATRAASWADEAGVDSSELRIAYARWVIRDLACGRELPEELRQAAGAAIVAGDEALAQELLA
ncbi:hypothetical protein LCGC14_1422180 [marine sediment metagenome]|uniref:Uncharacterized protein n=1 Tax=marine sediment metagenome TaxID=412755 RepID=A0A0F9M6L4_9ZZZZ